MEYRCGSLSYIVPPPSKRNHSSIVNTRATHADSLQSVDRRSFVRGVGVLSGVIALGHPLAALLPSRVWAVELRVLSSAEAAVLLAMIRTIAPHDTLDDAAYALVVSAVDADAAGSMQARTDLKTGVASLGDEFAVKPK